LQKPDSKPLCGRLSKHWPCFDRSGRQPESDRRTGKASLATRTNLEQASTQDRPAADSD